MSKRVINFVVVMLFCFFIVFLGLRIGYDTSLIEEADDEYNKSKEEFDKDSKTVLNTETTLKYVNFDNIK